MDVKMAFLNGILKEEVYVSQLEGFVDQEHLNHVFRLKKALYGLKQAPRAWNDLFFKFLLGQKFVKGVVDPTLFTRKEGNDRILYGLEQCDAVDIPMVERSKLDEDPNGTPVDPTHYRGTINRGLWYPKDTGFDLTAFIDADHAGCQESRKIHREVHNSKEISLLAGPRRNKNIPLCCDSQSVFTLSCNTVQHSKTKHIAIRCHFIKEQVKNEVLELYFIKTAYQLADIFTKALARERFKFLIKRLGMQSITPKELKLLAESEEEE
ncbi:retrovirus-related pol polyprotein from transposon TNT 1-94 [Tanacetum coccineum]